MRAGLASINRSFFQLLPFGKRRWQGRLKAGSADLAVQQSLARQRQVANALGLDRSRFCRPSKKLFGSWLRSSGRKRELCRYVAEHTMSRISPCDSTARDELGGQPIKSSGCDGLSP